MSLMVLRNDKFNFSEWTIKDRQDACREVFEDIGVDEAVKRIFDEVAARYNLEELEGYDWEDVEDADDAFYHAAYCSPYQAVVDLAALTYVNGNWMSWKEAVEDVFRQLS